MCEFGSLGQLYQTLLRFFLQMTGRLEFRETIPGASYGIVPP